MTSLAFFLAFVDALKQEPSLNLIPKPAIERRLPGSFVLTKDAHIEATGEAAKVAKMFVESTGVGQLGGNGDAAIEFTIDRNLVLGSEGYLLKVEPQRIRAAADSYAGILYAMETLRQLLPPKSEWGSRDSVSIPAVSIEDHPRFGWRGMLLDVSRHFFRKEQVKRTLDNLASLKFNVFHWHLVDDGGWRIEIKKYPKLTEFGGFRTWTDKWDYGKLDFPGQDADVRKYGGYYTQEDVKEIVQYAADRNITIVPEIEMPGHSMAALASYPFLACTDYDKAGVKKETGNATPNVYCAGKESTFDFMTDVLDEVCALFPSQYVHIGGDEVDKYLWDHCPDCKKRMAAEGLKNGAELESYFIKRIERYLNGKGKKLIGWDEIMEGGLAPSATVMSWRGVNGGIAAAKDGHDVVMTPTSHCYFDYSYSTISTEKVYSYDPMPKELLPREGDHVLGAQFNVWTEWIPTDKRMEEMMFPRCLALAEVVWTPQELRGDYADFDRRAAVHFGRLVADGIRLMLPTPAAEGGLYFLFEHPTNVRFNGPTFPGLTLRYTIDGSDPAQNSPLYLDGIALNKPAVVKAAYVSNRGLMGEIAATQVVDPPDPIEGTITSGLRRRVFEGDWDTVPNFASLKPKSESIVKAIELPSDLQVSFAVQHKGLIDIPEDGKYAFYLSSDDGSWLKLAGRMLIDNDGPHGAVLRQGAIFLKKGTYPFEVGFFQAGGDLSLVVEVAAPGKAKGPIPASWLKHIVSNRRVAGSTPRSRW